MMNKTIVFTIAALIVTLAAAVGFAEAAPSSIQVGDHIFFGQYEQDNDLGNGQEPIEWRVLEIEGNTALIISQYALDAKPYNEKPARASWVKSTLRAWLNEDFYNTAFSEEDKLCLFTKEIVNWKEESTWDTVFLLDNDQAKHLFANHADRQTTPTDYAIAQGAYRSKKYGPGNAQWWLRTKSWEERHRAAYVAGSGGVMTCGGNSDGKVENAKWAVRPAVYLDLTTYNP